MKGTTIILLLLSSLNLGGQIIEPSTLISNANYYESSEGISLQSSFGELMTEVITGNGTNITQGFIQTYMQLVPVKENLMPDLKVKVGPIPCTTYFNIEKNTDETLTAQLFDTNGRIIRTNILESEQTAIDVSSLSSGSYFLILNKENEQVFKAIKIIKQ